MARPAFAALTALLVSACLGGTRGANSVDIADSSRMPVPGSDGSRPDSIRLCVVEDGGLRTIMAHVDLVTGDTLINGVLIGDSALVNRPPYAGGMDWFMRRSPITFQTKTYTWHGPTVVLQPEELRMVGSYGDLPLFAEADPSVGLSVLLVPVRPGCEFQPYYYFRGPSRPRD